MTDPATLAKQLADELPSLGTPSGAFDNCYAASQELCNALHDAGMSGYVVQVSGYRGPDRLPEVGLSALWRQIGKQSWCHYVVQIGDLYIDMTARQFDPDAAYPLFENHDQLLSRWSHLHAR